MPISASGRTARPVPATLAVATALTSLALAAVPAHAHDSASGWPYPQECCSNQDCRTIAAGQVRPGHDGYLIRTSGEIVVYSDSRVRKSPDGKYHWCSNGGRADGRTICLFVPQELF